MKVTESQGEQNTILLFCQDPKVSRIETQFEYLNYIDSDGVQRSTAYDARVSYYDGLRTLVSHKPKVRAEKTGHFELNDLILDQVPSDIADQAQTITELDIPQWSLANARLFQSVLNDRFWVCLEALREHARNLSSPVTISDFCGAFWRHWGLLSNRDQAPIRTRTRAGRCWRDRHRLEGQSAADGGRAVTFVRQRGNVLRELKLNPYTYVEIDGKRWDPIGIVSDGYELKGQKVGEGRFLFHGEFDRLQKEGRLKVFDNLGLFTKRLNIAPSDRDAMFLRFFG
ncbi:hypothetical protein [Devosia sp.]|uniref:hypothetical protein n=1 Tax=Devosia sp. TaxID=1871048 RepID=UPI0025E911F9|nr:hypothetical protein [Devosia sp.]MCR6633487.1 hypothetical protein [Devosia sp.]